MPSPLEQHAVSSGLPHRHPGVNAVLAVMLLAMVVVPAALYSPVASFPFVNWDDPKNITSNPLYSPLPIDHMTEIWTRSYFYLYIPLVRMVWGDLADISNDPNGMPVATFNPAKYHIVNLALHIVNVILVFLIVRRIVRKDWAAAMGAMLFAVHPLQVEPVVWVTGMRDVLSAVFSLLAVYLYLRFTESDTQTGSWGPYVGAIVSYVLSLLCKPTSVVIPVIAGILGWLSVRNGPRPTATGAVPMSPRRITALGLWIVAMIPAAVATVLIQPADRNIPSIGFWKGIFVAGDSYSFYLLKAIAPLSLAIDYGRTPARVLAHGWVYFEILVPIMLIVAGWIAYRNGHVWPLASVSVFLIGIFPVSGITPFLFQTYSTVADRYMYFVMCGFSIAFAGVVAACPTRVGASGGLLVLILLACLTSRQIPVWRNSISLFTQTIRVNPDSMIGYYTRGYERMLGGDMTGAIADYRMALVLNPTLWAGNENLGICLVRDWVESGKPLQKSPEAQEGLHRLLTAEQFAPGNMTAHMNLGYTYDNMGRPIDAAAEFSDALSIDPSNSDALSARNSIERQIASAIRRK